MTARLCLWCSPPERRGSPCDCRLCLSYRAGLSLLKIAAIEGASVTRVRNLLIEHETPLRARGYPKGLARKVVAAAGPPLLALLLCLLLPCGAEARGHGGFSVAQPKPPTAQVPSASSWRYPRSGDPYPLPQEWANGTILLSSATFRPPLRPGEVRRLGQTWRTPDGRLWYGVARQVTQDGGIAWAIRFEEVR